MDEDWIKVVNRGPKGFLRAKTAGDAVLYGPIDEVVVENNEVSIRVKWLIYTKTENIEKNDAWVLLSDSPKTIMRFPNILTPYRIQSIPGKGDCILFGPANILYIDYFEEVDTSRVKGFNPR